MIASSLFVVTLALAGSVNATSAGIAGGNGAIGDGSAVPAAATGYGPNTGLDTVHRWNRIAVDASGIDHTPVAPGEDRVFGEQLGPGRSSRAMAIVHIAIFDSVNAIVGGYQSYTQFQSSHLHPKKMAPAINHMKIHGVMWLRASSARSGRVRTPIQGAIRNGREKTNGIVIGQRAAAAILAMRVGDGSEIPEPHLGVNYFPSDQPGRWREDPISQLTVALGAHWGDCRTFVLTTPQQFRSPAPPALTSREYTAAYNEAKRLGGDGIVTPTERTPDQTFIGTFWAYDGTPSLCAPPRLYNQIAVVIADQKNLSTIEFARLLALVNTAMADAGVAVWDSKYYWDFWRPVAGIRESDPGTGLTRLGDGNPDTRGDPNFSPLGAPASNLNGPNFTPPFPAYPSGHAGFGGALFQTLRRFFGTDRIPFTLVSDEFNGTTRASDGTVRPYRPRSFATLSQAEEENGQSRIYLGIHWKFDKTEGIALGRRVGDYVFDHAFLPAHPIQHDLINQ